MMQSIYMCSRINSLIMRDTKIAKLTLYKQYKSTNLDMSYVKLQLKLMLRSPKFYLNFN